ncbi:hypothetical protein GPECTOR_17g957 [Gonium pectorale]|uniref:Phosphodiesterase n=1 Tax=Gonium pectorale TaxID=33097 RepID=A0A150GKL2_GONPE|nr:hypothetical protein GPECTOR_17g957 [Gonium pectorale]|eukprot:KXZ50318.1 hypothetical protein GPECTOR_17g957 [Gonium pectorale]
MGVARVCRAYPATLVWPLLCLGLLLGVGVWGVVKVAQVEERGAKDRAASHAISTAVWFKQQLNVATAPVLLMAAIVNYNPRYSEVSSLFEGLAPAIYQQTLSPILRSIEFVPHGVVRNTFSPAGHQTDAVGFDLFNSVQDRDDAVRTVSTRVLTLVGPLDLAEGGRAVIVRQPVFVANASQDETFGIPDPINPLCGQPCAYNATSRTKFWGFSAALLNLDSLKRLAEQELRLDALGYRFVVRAPGAAVSEWTVSLAPSAGWRSSSFGGLMAAAVLASFAMALLLFAALVSRREHEMLLRALLPKEIIKDLRGNDSTLRAPRIVQAETISDLMLGMLGRLLLGVQPDLGDVVFIRQALLRGADLYQPLNLNQQFRSANLDKDVARALMRQLGHRLTTHSMHSALTTLDDDAAFSDAGDCVGNGGGGGGVDRTLTRSLTSKGLGGAHDCSTLAGALALLLAPPQPSEAWMRHAPELAAALLPGGESSATDTLLAAARVGGRDSDGRSTAPSPRASAQSYAPMAAAVVPVAGSAANGGSGGAQSLFRDVRDRDILGGGSSALPSAADNPPLGSSVLNELSLELARTPGPGPGPSGQPILQLGPGASPFGSSNLGLPLPPGQPVATPASALLPAARSIGRTPSHGRTRRPSYVLADQPPGGPGGRLPVALAAEVVVPMGSLAALAAADCAGNTGSHSAGSQDDSVVVRSGNRPVRRPPRRVASALSVCAYGGTDGPAPRASNTGREGRESGLLGLGFGLGAGPSRRSLVGAQRPSLAGAGKGAAAVLQPQQPPPPPSPAVIEEIERVLAQADSWQFDTWRLREVTNGHPLSALGFYLIQRSGLITGLKLKPTILARLLRHIEAGYNDNPYHNATHAADVLQTLHVILHGAQMHINYVDQLGLLAAYFAAIIHDYGHPGLTNDFLIATADPLAVRYNDRSPLENHHAAAAFSTMRRAGLDILGPLTKQERANFRKQVIEMVLATDMKQHFGLLSQFNTVHRLAGFAQGAASGEVGGAGGPGPGPVRNSPSGRAGGTGSSNQVVVVVDNGAGAETAPKPIDETERLLSLQVLIKVADLGHLGEEIEVHKRWLSVLEEEFFRQGDKERQLGMPISPLFDRAKQGVSKSQTGFYEFVALPLVHALCSAFPGSTPLMRCFMGNYNHWRSVDGMKASPPTEAPKPAQASSGKGRPSGEVRVTLSGAPEK